MVSLYFFLNLMASFFSLVSLALLAPFLGLIFGVKGQDQMMGSRFRLGNITNNFYSYLTELINSDTGKIKALGILCIIVVISILLKNIFM
jgi:subfamily B ATP-binding cassette protein MsbA